MQNTSHIFFLPTILRYLLLPLLLSFIVKPTAQGQESYPMTFTDSQGNMYQVEVEERETDSTSTKVKTTYLGRQTTPVPPDSYDRNRIDNAQVDLTFIPSGKYAFDAWTKDCLKSGLLRNFYQTVGDDYCPPWKLMVEGGTDFVKAKVAPKVEGFNPKLTLFTTPQGTRYEGHYDSLSQEYTLNLASGANRDVQEIYALYPKPDGKYFTLGKLNVLTVARQTVKLEVIEVDGGIKDENTFKTYLDSVYAKVGVGFDISIQKFDYQGEKADFFDKKSGAWQDYNDRMRALIKAYRAEHPTTKGSYYLFVLNSSGESRPESNGFMPRGNTYGFVFVNGGNAQTLSHTAAHELGHGVWSLRHTFDEAYGSAIAATEGTTQNLMDYSSNGTQTAYFQWSAIIDPPLWVNPFEGDDAGMANLPKGVYVAGKHNYVMPNNVIIELENITVLPICDDYSNDGFLFSFIENGVVWNANAYYNNPNELSFDGYIKGDNKQQKYPNESKKYVKENDIVCKVSYDKNAGTLTVSEVKLLDTKNVVSIFHPSYFQLIKNINTGTVTNPCNSGNTNVTSDYIVLDNLNELQDNKRSNQDIERENWEGEKGDVLKIYHIVDGKLTEVSNPLSDNAIENGNWSGGNETKIRYTVNSKGIIQIKAFGFRKDLQIANKHTANLPEIAKQIKDQTNKLLADNSVTDFKRTYSDASEAFADGEEIKINGKFIKIISEGIGITTTLLKTGEVEENVYKTGTKETATIHAPGLVTGCVEVVAQKVTDLTSLASLVYNVAVDEQVRTGLKTQFKEIKDEIGEDPKNLLPMLVDVIVSVTTNKTPEQIQSIFDEKTDAGQRTHYAVSSTGNAIMTVMAGAAIIKDLPEIAEKLGENIKKAKKVFSSIEEFFTNIVNNRNTIRKVLDTDAGKAYAKKYFDNIVKEGNFEEWYTNTFKKYDLGGNKGLMEELLEKMTSPKFHKIRNDNPVISQYISMPALGYAKLACVEE